MADHEDLVVQFSGITEASPEQAAQYLSASQWDLAAAVTAYFADQEETADVDAGMGSSSSAQPEPEIDPAYTGPRTLDGRPAPWAASASSSSSSSAAAGKKPQKRTGIATLSSLGGGGGGAAAGGGPAHGHDEDEEDEDEEDDPMRGPRDLYAGGEKSGISVQDPAQRSDNNPKKLIEDIIAKAKANSRRPEAPSPNPAAARASSSFRGSGQTLGGDGTESRTIPDPNAASVPSSSSAAGNNTPRGGARSREDTPTGPMQERVLHLWQDGFSIDDGELRRFDDPANHADLQMIRQGRAPLHLMNVSYDQPVDVKLQQHAGNYRPLPKVYRPFGGEGRRLGSPVPGDGGSAAATAATTTTVTTTTTPQAAAAAAPAPSSGADESQPTLVLRIQLPDGTRLPARFNPTQTVGDVYAFVARVSPSLAERTWVLATTFPNKEHADRDLRLGDMPEFKKGGTAVVKWA